MQPPDESEQKVVYKQYKLIEGFRDFLLAGNQYTHNTIKNYLSDLRHFLGFLNIYHPGTYDSLNISPQVLLAYKQSMQSARTSNITVKRRLSAVNKFISFLPQNEGITHQDNEFKVDNGEQYRPRITPSTRHAYLNTLLSEYVSETGLSLDSKNVIRDFLISTQL